MPVGIGDAFAYHFAFDHACAVCAVDHAAMRHTVDRFALDHAFDDPPLALNGLGDAALTRRILDIARLGLHRLRLFRGLVGRGIRYRGFGDVHRSTCKQRTARSSRGQFRQGHLYRHGQALSLLSGHPERGGSASRQFPVTSRDAHSR